jgi:hypothetical protein
MSIAYYSELPLSLSITVPTTAKNMVFFIDPFSMWPEMEVTKRILAKVSSFCLLSAVPSHKRGFLSDLRFVNP